MLETAYSFLEYRRSQELERRKHACEALPGLLTIEVNITELCNRKCVFCPRVDPEKYPNHNIMIPKQVVDRLVSEVKRLGYHSKISFSGFGEPTLNPTFLEIIRKFRAASDDLVIETNTNGDKLSSEDLDDLYDAGLSSFYWNLYDGPEQLEKVEKIIAASKFPAEKIRIRPHWEGCDLEKEAGLILNNRSGALSPLDTALHQSCNYPFYKMFVDWNGNVLSCSNDWFRKYVVGNIMYVPLDKIWMDPKWHQFRMNLYEGNRSMNSPCNTCDVEGTLFGNDSVATYLKRWYDESSLSNS